MVAVARSQIARISASRRGKASSRSSRAITTVGRLCAAAVREAVRQGAPPEQAEKVAALAVAELLLKAGQFEAARALLAGE